MCYQSFFMFCRIFPEFQVPFTDMAVAAKCEAAVLEYLTKQNRPYSVNDVVLNLHKEHGKSAVQKALDVLVADARVKEKVGAVVGGTNNYTRDCHD